MGAGNARGADQLPATPPAFAEAPLAAVDRPVFYLPLWAAGAVPAAVAAWLTAPLRTRCIGPVYDRRRDSDHHVSAGPLADAVDAFLHVHQVTPTTPLIDAAPPP